MEPQDNEVVAGALWSDPVGKPGVGASTRGIGVFFGPDVTKGFLGEICCLKYCQFAGSLVSDTDNTNLAKPIPIPIPLTGLKSIPIPIPIPLTGPKSIPIPIPILSMDLKSIPIPIPIPG